MNASAVNFDPLANVPTRCVPRVAGCMMPSALNYDPSATVSDPARCVLRVAGALDQRGAELCRDRD